MSSSILDASAMLALLQSEPGASEVTAALIEGALMSTVNLAEVVTKLSEHGIDEASARVALAGIEISYVDFTVDYAVASGALRPTTRELGLSLGDRSCLALALDRGLPVLTADRQWSGVPALLSVEVRLLR